MGSSRFDWEICYLFKVLDMLVYSNKEENADIIINDIDKDKVNRISNEYKVKILSNQKFYEL